MPEPGRAEAAFAMSQPENWEAQPKEHMALYLGQIKADYFAIVLDYQKQADRTVEQYRTLMAANLKWRRRMIIATGVLAAINVCAAVNLLNIEIPFGAGANAYKVSLPAVLSAVAALYAGALTVVGNIENLGRRAERAMGFREAREILLDQYWEYYFLWYRYVESRGLSSAACENAGQLCKQLVEADCALRKKLKQFTEVPAQSSPGTSSSATAASSTLASGTG